MPQSWLLLLTLLVSAPLFAAPNAQRYALILQDAPAGKAMKPGGARDAPEVLAARQNIRQKQTALRSQLSAAGFHVTGATNLLLNAVYVIAQRSDVPKLKAMPGVMAVVMLHKLHMDLNAAVTLLDAPSAWNLLGGTSNAGAGVKIAILDTGIDQTHPAFQDSTLTAPAINNLNANEPNNPAFTNSKVIVARSYVDISEAAYGTGPEYSTPDDTSPTDRVGHGTAVAMCAGGNTNTGPLATITGLAPKAFLGNYKIYGSPGIIDFLTEDAFLLALEDAVSDGMNIVSFSSGGPAFSGPLDTDASTGGFCTYELGTSVCDPLAQAVEQAIAAGVSFVAASGNEGDYGYFDNGPLYNTVGSPAYAPDAIAVGATGNGHIATQTVTVAGPNVPSTLTAIQASEDDVTFLDAGLPSIISGTIVDTQNIGDVYACSNFPGASLTNDIALISRGGPNDCTFSTKLDNAENAGAVGAIIYDDGQSSGLIQPDVDGTASIPAFFITTANGHALKSYVDANPSAVGGLSPSASGFIANPSQNQVTVFSSRGPALGGDLKPDIAAPGDSIYMATQDFDPNGELYDPSRYIAAGGTSFSTPMITGIAALVLQAHPTYNPYQVKSAVVDTGSTVTNDPWIAFNMTPSSVLSVGGGLGEALNAVQSNVTVVPATVSFGVYASTITSVGSASGTLTVTNTSSASQTLSLTVNRRNADSTTQITLSRTSFTLLANASQTVTVTFAGSKPAAGIYEGTIGVTGGAVPLTVPWMYIVGDGVPAQFYSLTGDQETGAVGQVVPDGFSSFQVIDQYGVPVPGIPVTWSATNGGQVEDADTSTNMYGQALATTILGTTPGNYTFEANVQGFTTYDFEVAAIPIPQINTGGAVNAATYTLGSGIAPGSLISVFGTGLVDGPSLGASTLPLPIALNYTEVGFDGTNVSVPGALLYISSDQINVQVPWELAGQSSVDMKVNIEPVIGNLITVPVTTYSPGVFAPNGIAAALNLPAYSVVSTSNPATHGQYIALYCTGLGPVANQPADGYAAGSNSTTSTNPTVTIGGQTATVTFSGLAPGYVGVYQVNLLVPSGLTSGTQPLVLSIGGVAAASVGLPVQ